MSPLTGEGGGSLPAFTHFLQPLPSCFSAHLSPSPPPTFITNRHTHPLPALPTITTTPYLRCPFSYSPHAIAHPILSRPAPHSHGRPSQRLQVQSTELRHTPCRPAGLCLAPRLCQWMEREVEGEREDEGGRGCYARRSACGLRVHCIGLSLQGAPKGLHPLWVTQNATIAAGVRRRRQRPPRRWPACAARGNCNPQAVARRCGFSRGGMFAAVRAKAHQAEAPPAL